MLGISQTREATRGPVTRFTPISARGARSPVTSVDGSERFHKAPDNTNNKLTINPDFGNGEWASGALRPACQQEYVSPWGDGFSRKSEFEAFHPCSQGTISDWPRKPLPPEGIISFTSTTSRFLSGPR
jgi:hypothetical protein